jgi:hypothetical protein
MITIKRWWRRIWHRRRPEPVEPPPTWRTHSAFLDKERREDAFIPERKWFW